MIVQKSIRFGLILGAINLAVNALLYVANLGIMAQGIIGMVVFIAILVMWIMFSLRVRQANGNVFSFGEAFQSLFIIGVISMVIGVIWQVLLYQMIDPGYGERMLETSIDMAEQFGGELPADKIEEMKEQFTLAGQLKGGVWGIAIMAILSLIISMIIKKSEPQAKTLDAQ